MTLEQAEQLFKWFGCMHYHMWHDETEKYEQYKSLNISEVTEKCWAIEEFNRQYNEFAIEPQEEIWWKFDKIVSLSKILKENEYFVKMIELTNRVIDFIPLNDIPIMISEITGNSGSETHGGLIQYVVEINNVILAKEFIDIVNLLLEKANKENIDVDCQKQYLDDILKAYKDIYS
jgi:hypothetical protein